MDFLVQVAEMVLDIAWRHISVWLNLFEKFLENSLGWFLKHTMKSIQSTSVGHTHNNMFDLIFGGDLNHFSKGRCESIEALDTKSFEVGKFGNQEIDKALIPAKPLESVDSLFFAGLEDFETLNSSFDKRLEEISLLFTSQMHVLITDFIHVSIS